MKLNRILAAAIVATAAMPAMASISLPGTGNGELFLVVWDQVDQVSYTKDLGLFMDTFNGNADASFALSDANFLAFLSIAGTTASDIKYAVIAGDNQGVKRLFSTIDNAVTPYNNGNLTAGTGYVDLYANNQVTLSQHTTHAGPVGINGNSYDVAPNGAYFLTQNGPSYQNSIVGGTWSNSNLVETSSVFRSFSSVGTSGGTQTLKTDFAGLWNVSLAGGANMASYTVAAVPEGDGIAMMFAGLGALGFVVRRRRRQS